MTKSVYKILLTNDDGVSSPGLLAAAEALSEIGDVWVVAPGEQCSGVGRSMPGSSTGVITLVPLQLKNKQITGYGVDGTPAQAVQFGILEVMPGKPDLTVSGINYGENIGTGVTISGTVGAALESAAMGVPALAISLETSKRHHLSLSKSVDFSTAAHFTRVFAERMLANKFPHDLDVLKVEVPVSATPLTPWSVARLTRDRYFLPVPPKREDWSQPAGIGYRQNRRISSFEPGSDAHTLRILRQVAVTPLSLDLTSRLSLDELANLLR